MKLLKGIKLVLVILIIVFSVRLVSKSGIITGKVVYSEEDYQCDFYIGEEINPIPLDYCCAQIQQQLRCDSQEDVYKCYVSEEDRFYVINEKTKNFCEKEGYYIEPGS